LGYGGDAGAMLSTRLAPKVGGEESWLPKKWVFRNILSRFLNVPLTTPKLNPFQTRENLRAAIV